MINHLINYECILFTKTADLQWRQECLVLEWGRDIKVSADSFAHIVNGPVWTNGVLLEQSSVP